MIDDQPRLCDSLPGYNAYEEEPLQKLIQNTTVSDNTRPSVLVQSEIRSSENLSSIVGSVEKPIVVKKSDKPFKTFKDSSFKCQCYNCNTVVDTKVVRKSKAHVWIICTVLCLIGCFLGCCFIPFCIKKMKNYKHFCPECD